jgi:hypothetical protein
MEGSKHCIPTCISIAFNPWHSLSVPLLNISSWRNHEAIPEHDMAEIWIMLAEFLEREDMRFIGHNIKYDHQKLNKPLPQEKINLL